jgi:hypothetical protein
LLASAHPVIGVPRNDLSGPVSRDLLLGREPLVELLNDSGLTLTSRRDHDKHFWARLSDVGLVFNFLKIFDESINQKFAIVTSKICHNSILSPGSTSSSSCVEVVD